MFSASVHTSKQFSTAPLASTPSGELPEEQLAPLAKRAVAVSALPVKLPVTLPVRVPVMAVPNRLVNLPLVAKRLVEVALVPVAFRKVKFWRVEEPVVNIPCPFKANTSSLAILEVAEAPNKT